MDNESSLSCKYATKKDLLICQCEIEIPKIILDGYGYYEKWCVENVDDRSSIQPNAEAEIKDVVKI